MSVERVRLSVERTITLSVERMNTMCLMSIDKVDRWTRMTPCDNLLLACVEQTSLRRQSGCVDRSD